MHTHQYIDNNNYGALFRDEISLDVLESLRDSFIVYSRPSFMWICILLICFLCNATYNTINRIKIGGMKSWKLSGGALWQYVDSAYYGKNLQNSSTVGYNECWVLTGEQRTYFMLLRRHFGMSNAEPYLKQLCVR